MDSSFFFDAEDLGKTQTRSPLTEAPHAGDARGVDYKSSALAEMGDRGHNGHGRKEGGLLCPFCGELGPRLIQCGLDQRPPPCQVPS